MDMGSCTMDLAKVLMMVFNFVFFLSGLALIIIGGVIRSEYGEYFTYADFRFASAELFIIGIGVIVLIIGFFGCCGAWKENYWMITIFAVSLCLIFILEIAAGIVGYHYRSKVEKAANGSLERAVANYNKEPGAKHLLDWAQETFTCCGKNGSKDFDTKVGNSTVSGCGGAGQGVASCHKGNKCSGELHTEGCKQRVVDFVKSNMYVIGAVAVGIAFIQLLGILLACCLMKAIKGEYEAM